MSLLESYLTEDALAGELNSSTRTLQNWRQRGVGPPWTRCGKRVLYERDAFLAWLKSQQQQPNHPRSRRLRNPDQLRRREHYRPDSSPKGVKIGRRSGVKFARRLTAKTGTARNAAVIFWASLWIGWRTLISLPSRGAL